MKFLQFNQSVTKVGTFPNFQRQKLGDSRKVGIVAISNRNYRVIRIQVLTVLMYSFSQGLFLSLQYLVCLELFWQFGLKISILAIDCTCIDLPANVSKKEQLLWPESKVG